jgi:hypothetical protein
MLAMDGGAWTCVADDVFPSMCVRTFYFNEVQLEPNNSKASTDVVFPTSEAARGR